MTFVNKPNAGSMLRNDWKKPGEQTPDWKGDAKIEVKQHEVVCTHCGGIARVDLEIDRNVAAWEAQTTQGKPRLSLKFSDPREYAGRGAAGARAACAESTPRHAPVSSGPAPRQGDLVKTAEAVSRDLAEFDDEIPF